MNSENTPITAYKFVVFGKENFHSPSVEFEWLPGWNIIRNGPIDRDGKNGFYSLKDKPKSDFMYPCVVELELAGTVIECEFGYRSEFARIARVVDWSSGWGDPRNYRAVSQRYEDDHSLGRCRSVWPMKTPFTRVYQLPDYPKVSVYNIPIAPIEPVKHTLMDDGSIVVPYEVVSIHLDLAYMDNRGFYQYGYSAKHDILVYRRLQD